MSIINPGSTQQEIKVIKGENRVINMAHKENSNKKGYKWIFNCRMNSYNVFLFVWYEI